MCVAYLSPYHDARSNMIINVHVLCTLISVHRWYLDSDGKARYMVKDFQDQWWRVVDARTLCYSDLDGNVITPTLILNPSSQSFLSSSSTTESIIHRSGHWQHHDSYPLLNHDDSERSYYINSAMEMDRGIPDAVVVECQHRNLSLNSNVDNDSDEDRSSK